MSKSNKLIIIVLIIVALVIGGYFIIKANTKKDEQNNQTDNNTVNQNVLNNNGDINNSSELNNTVNVAENNNSDYNENTQISESIYKISISSEDRFKALYYSKDFNRVDSLTAKEMINVAGIAIYHGWVNIQGTKINEDETGAYQGLSYTVSDIRSAVYAIFGVEIKENISADFLLYKDGKYVLNPADGDTMPSRVKMLESDVAAGTSYYTFELYGESTVSDEEEQMGTYVVGITGEMVKSKEQK